MKVKPLAIPVNEVFIQQWELHHRGPKKSLIAAIAKHGKLVLV